jgi:hypothetical protein
LTTEQEAVIVAFLETFALGNDAGPLQEDAQQALEEWWLPNARHRPPQLEEKSAMRTQPPTYHVVDRAQYRLALPVSFTSSGARHIPEESRTVEVWGGVLFGDVPMVVAVNVTPLANRHLRQITERTAAGLRAAAMDDRPVHVAGSTRSHRLDGLTRGDSPAEPERITIVAALIGEEVVTVSVRSWPRDDVEAAIGRIVASFELCEPPAAVCPASD